MVVSGGGGESVIEIFGFWYAWYCSELNLIFWTMHIHSLIKFFIVQLLSCVQLFATPGIAACQASLSFSIAQSLLKLLSIELVMPSNHLILRRPFLLLPSTFPSIGVFSNESAFCIRWQKYFNHNIWIKWWFQIFVIAYSTKFVKQSQNSETVHMLVRD